jgi:putative membrane protein
MERISRRNLWLGLGILGLFIALLMAGPAFGGGMALGRGFGLIGPMGFGARPFIGVGAPWLWGVFGFGLLVRFAFWALVIFLVVSLFRRGSARRFSAYRPREELSSDEILRRRYAAGEISREQYAEMRRTLEATP